MPFYGYVDFKNIRDRFKSIADPLALKDLFYKRLVFPHISEFIKDPQLNVKLYFLPDVELDRTTFHKTISIKPLFAHETSPADQYDGIDTTISYNFP